MDTYTAPPLGAIIRSLAGDNWEGEVIGASVDRTGVQTVEMEISSVAQMRRWYLAADVVDTGRRLAVAHTPPSGPVNTCVHCEEPVMEMKSTRACHVETQRRQCEPEKILDGLDERHYGDCDWFCGQEGGCAGERA